ncbi:MAG TPA: hypothetical protein VFJ77_06740, partial [Gaiellaceae bacterium]|nr:hypothetical protein [Gaiellaceae bacterium]
MKKFSAALALACALLAVTTAGAATRQGDHGGGHKKAHATKKVKKAHHAKKKAKAAAPTHSGSTISVKAAGPLEWGVADDASKYADDGGSSFYGLMQGANLTSNRWTLAWDAANPTAIKELPFIQRAAPKAQAAGIHVVLALYAGKNGGSSPDG